MIITIDGPAGAGKSSIARQLAKTLGYQYLDTGAMYRSIALAGMRHGVDWQDTTQLAEVAKSVQIVLDEDRVLLDGEDVSDEIRTMKVTRLTRFAADNLAVRRELVQQQRKIAHYWNERERGIVCEGRDQGTVAFPDARCKIFLTATDEVRAERRWQELQTRGESKTLQEVLDAQRQRDREDSSRPEGALRPAEDAIEVWTDRLTPDEVLSQLQQIVQNCQCQ
ncbi:Cytidylate kinase [Planctomycetales bacterium 10988]|nr:Cytidylate kinase [Planctomycetales bacterium 10988]